MIHMITGIKVTLVNKTQNGKDEFNVPIYSESSETVENVLVGEPTGEDITADLDLYGKRLAYTLAIPKGDTHTWEDQVVEFDPTGGSSVKRFRVYGPVTAGIEKLIPLNWNKKVKVERYE